MLTFLRDGKTTREEILLRLGVPTAQLEGDRILMYQLNVDARGRWYLSAPKWSAIQGMRTWRTSTSSLVLVLDDAGLLTALSTPPQAERVPGALAGPM